MMSLIVPPCIAGPVFVNPVWPAAMLMILPLLSRTTWGVSCMVANASTHCCCQVACDDKNGRNARRTGQAREVMWLETACPSKHWSHGMRNGGRDAWAGCGFTGLESMSLRQGDRPGRPIESKREMHKR